MALELHGGSDGELTVELVGTLLVRAAPLGAHAVGDNADVGHDVLYLVDADGSGDVLSTLLLGQLLRLLRGRVVLREVPGNDAPRVGQARGCERGGGGVLRELTELPCHSSRVEHGGGGGAHGSGVGREVCNIGAGLIARGLSIPMSSS